MRFSLSFVLGLILISTAHAQQPTNLFPDSNAVWREQRIQLVQVLLQIDSNTQFPVWANQDVRTTYTLEDTMILNGIEYRQLHKSGIVALNEATTDSLIALESFDVFEGLIRKGAGKTVYFWKAGFPAEALLYDFDLVVGDSIPRSYINSYIPTVVSAIDTITIGGQVRKRFHLQSNQAPVLQTIIEGIGTDNGLLEHLGVAFDWSNTLLCFGQNDQHLYPVASAGCGTPFVSTTTLSEAGTTAWNAYPNPANEQVWLEAPQAGNYQISLISSMGKHIYSGITNGLSPTQIDLSEQAAGLYVLRMCDTQRNTCEQRKLVIR